MVNLSWKNKRRIENLEHKIQNHINYFQLIDLENDKKNNSIDWPKTQKNLLFWGDNLKVCYHLLNSLENQLKLIYIDPPFFSGSNYTIEINQHEKSFESIAYEDRWNNNLDLYLQFLFKRLTLFKKLLSEDGLIFVHLDWHASHYIRMILDEIFGADNFINKIIWYYYNKYSASKTNLPRAHDEILLYSKSKNYSINEIRIPREKPRKQLKRVMVDGVLKNAKDKNGNVIYRIVKDKKLDDVWRIPCMQPASKQWTGYPTQKHHKLLERIIKLGSNEGDLIGDFFCGSGTTLYSAEKLKRNWIGSDTSKYSIYITLRRLINYSNEKSKNENFSLFTHITPKKEKIITSGFFRKNLTIKRKK
jgi:adenine specific DNA methylase Mod